MTDLDAVKNDVTEIKETVRDIYKILNGNGKIGIVTKVELNKQAIGRAWWWLGGVSLAIFGIAICVIKKGF